MQVLEIWSKFRKIWVCRKLDKQRESFSPNTDHFLAFFTVFTVMDKNEVKCKAKLRFNYFSVNVSLLAIVFHRQISKNKQFHAKLSVFWNFSAKYNSYYGKVHRKVIWTLFCITFHFLFIHCFFQNSASFKNNKKR